MIRYEIYKESKYNRELILETIKEEEADALKNFLDLVY